MRRRKGWEIAVGLVALGCGDVDVSDESSNPFGDSTASSSTSASTQGTAATAASQGTQGTATGEPTGPSTAEGSSSGQGPTTDPTDPTTATTTTTATSESSGSPGEGQLGDCLGTGAWSNCAQYCEANLEFCVEGGCDGQTVVYYNDIGACVDMTPDGGEAIACTEGFAMGGGISFARCCCT